MGLQAQVTYEKWATERLFLSAGAYVSKDSTPLRQPEERTNWVPTIPFVIAHLVPLLAIWTGVTWKAVAVGIGLFFLRMFFITAGYHRYFAHRSYRTSRAFQFLLAFGGTMAAQKGPLWWAANHRLHHRYTDTERDSHTPLKGILWSHIGWITSDSNRKLADGVIDDFAKYPELRFLNRFDVLGPITAGAIATWIAGWPGLVIGFFGSTLLTWHFTFAVNSVCHLVGRRRYATNDTSRNVWWIAIPTMGEGWHNNHHHYPAAVRQGFRWYEIDLTYLILRALSALHIVWDLRTPPERAIAGPRLRDGHFDLGMYRAHWEKAARYFDGVSAKVPNAVKQASATHRAALANARELAASRAERIRLAATAEAATPATQT